MPNWENPGRDYPSREDIREMNEQSRQRDRVRDALWERTDAYRKNHPSASWAEAEYYTRNQK